MKYIYTLLFLFVSSIANAELNCDQWVRAVNTDQKDMVMDVLFNPAAFNADPRLVYSSKITNYISWRGEQKDCTANVFHRAELELKLLQAPGEICTQTLTLHRLDHFVTLPTTSEYKMRDAQTSCVPFTAEEAAVISKCVQTSCDMVGNARAFPDFLDDCKCKLFDRMIQFKDESPNYENFFNPNVEFPKPEGVSSAFDESAN